eukprot:2864575-Lingulodinium_polyedra.AAC.1
MTPDARVPRSTSRRQGASAVGATGSFRASCVRAVGRPRSLLGAARSFVRLRAAATCSSGPR